MHWIDLTIMGVYIFGCMGAGLLARGKEESGEDYFTLMRANLAKLRKALGCR